MGTFSALKNRARAATGLLTAILLAGLGSVAQADILSYNQTVGTDWFEPLNWSGTTVPTSADEADIQSGTAVISDPGAVADSVAISDTLVLDGPSAGLAVTNGMLVGIDTATPAVLTVQGGATLTSANGYFGWFDNTTATGLVTGAGSSWINTGELQIGYSAGSTGSFTVTDGAYVSAANTLGLGNEGAGSLTISNTGTVAAGQLELGIGTPASGALTVTDGGSQLNITGEADIGMGGSGTMSVLNGGGVTVGGDAYIARGFGSSETSTVTVDGDGSRWDVSGTLSVGEFSSGTLSVQNGGIVTSGAAVISSNTNGHGTVIVDGENSQWIVSGNLGFRGTGTITVSSGGTLVSGTNAGAFTSIDHGGALIVTGAGSSFTSPNYLDIGSFGAGTFTLADGAQATTGPLYVGTSQSSSGTVTVDGAGSTWTILGDVDSTTYLGYGGDASVTVSNGGVVNNPGVTEMGFQTTSTNSVLTITGAGSQWNSTGDLSVGYQFLPSGHGRIMISDGGLLENANAYLSDGSSVTVTGSNSSWVVNGLLVTGSSAISLQDGSILYSGEVQLGAAAVTMSGSSQWNGSGGFSQTSGTLAIQDGSVFSFTNQTILDAATITVSGSSQWFSDGASVGNGTTVNLAIDTGGQVNWSSQANLGEGAGGQVIVTVSGTGSQLNAYGGLSLGDFGGTGSISVTQGGFLGLGNTTMDGGSTISIDGAGSSLSGGDLIVNSGTFSLTNGSTASVGSLSLGETGTGSGLVQGGSELNASSIYIGTGTTAALGTFVVDSGGKVTTSGVTQVGSTGTGTLLISGSGSQWTSGDILTIGSNRKGTVTVQNGGSLVAGSDIEIDRASVLTVTGTGSSLTTPGHMSIGGARTGTFSVLNGGTATIDGGMSVSSNASGTSTLLIDGVGSRVIMSSGETTLGFDGHVVATVSHGGRVDDIGLTIGYGTDSTASLTVTGSGSQWNSGGDLIIGTFGSGTLNILSGGAVSSSSSTLGSGGGGHGFVNVDGTGSQWTLTGGLAIGDSDTGVMMVSNGGKVTSASSLVGDTDGTATVTGTGSQWAAGDLTVGIRGQGTVNISSGGLITGTNGVVGDTSSGTGAVSVTGPGSRWNMAGDLIVGNDGVGTLNISNGGQVTSASGLLGSTFFGNGTVTVTGTGSRWNVTGGITIGDVGTGSLIVVNGGTVTSDASIIGTGRGDQAATALVSGTGSQWTITTASGTALTIGSEFSSDPISLTIDNGGKVNVSPLQQVIINPNASLFIGTGSAAGILTATGIQVGGLLEFNHSDNISFASGITNAGTIVKAGSGTLTITGAINFSTSGSVPVQIDGGALQIGNGGTVGGLTGNVNSGSNTAFIFNHSDAFTYFDNYTGGGALYQIGTGTLNWGGTDNYTGGTFIQAGVLRVIETTALPAAGTVHLAGGSLQLAANNSATFSGANVIVASSGTISVDHTLNTANLTHTMGTISIGSQTLTIGQGTHFGTNNVGSLVTGAVSLTGNPLFNFTNTKGTGVGTTTFGSLSDDGTARTLTKTGAATLILGSAAGSLTSGGTFVVNRGIAQLNASNALGSSALINVVVNGTTAGGTAAFNLNGVNQSVLSLTLGGAGATSTSTNNVATNTGTLTLGGDVTYDATNNPGASTISGNLALGNATRTFAIGDSTTAANDLTVSAVISGTSGLTKTGAGVLVLSGANTYTGTTTITSGTLAYGANNALANAGAVNVNGGVFNVLTFSDTVGAVTLGSGAIVGTTGTLAGSSYAVQSGSITARLGGVGALTQTGTGLVTLTGTSVYTGGTFLNGGTFALGANNLLANSGTVSLGGGTLNISTFSDTVGTVALASGAIVGTTGTLNGTSYAVQSGTISAILAGTGALTKTGSGLVVLSGTSSYTGGTFINGGTFALGANNLLANTGTVSLGGGTLDISTFSDTVGTVALASGAIVGTTGTLTGSSYAVQSGTISAILAGTGTLTKSNTGLAVLSGANSYTGGTIITGGTLALGASNALASTGTVSVNGGALSVGAFSNTTGAVSLVSGAILGSSGTLTGSSYAVQSGTISAILAGSGGLTKTTSGVVLLSGANRYSGATTVTTGTLVAGNNSAVGLSTVTIGTGATFLIDTGVSISNSVVVAGGTLAQNFASGASLANSVNGTSHLSGGTDTHAQLLAGTTSAAATVTSAFSTTSGASNDSGRSSDVLQLNGVPVVSGSTTDVFVLDLSMTSVAPGSMLGWINGSNTWVNAIAGNTGNNATAPQMGFAGDFASFQLAFGNDLSAYIGAWGSTGTEVWAVLDHNSSFAVIPEPSTWALLGVAMGLAVVFRRFRRGSTSFGR